MKSMKFLFMLFIFSSVLSAQNFQISGYVYDFQTKEPLIAANIFLLSVGKGAVTNNSGKYEISGLYAGDYKISASFIGYESKDSLISLSGNMNLNIYLDKTLLLIDGTVVKGTRAKFLETPIAFSELSSFDIEERLGSKSAISILEGVPGAFISEQGGGTGDLRLNIRGFDQTNIAVMINGIPINNPENGEIYWSNWAGIADVIDYVQIQRGLSASPYSVSSVGGMVNIVTSGVGGIKEGVKVKSEIGSNEYFKNSVSFSTKLSGNIGFTGLISRKTWEGYADQVFADEFTYYFSLGMIFGKHSLEFQLVGAPQNHGQRLTPQTIKTWAARGLKYNSDWGYLNGKPLNLRDNEFHKPSLNINHNWQINKDIVWSNIAYFSYGKGGGTVPAWYPPFSHTNEGLVDFDKEWQINSNNIDSNYSAALSRSLNALRFTYHIHNWVQLLSVIKYDWEDFVFSTGIDTKYYVAQNYSTIGNLLGGDYFIGSGNVNDNPAKLLMVGDKVDYDADSFTKAFGGFIQAEYNTEKLNTYLNFALSNTGYNRIDYFNYKTNDANRETGWKAFTSFTLKAGMNYNISNSSSIFINAGNYSKAPLSMNVYDYSNNPYENLKNEKIISVEGGYGLRKNQLQLKVNLFYTSWKDKAFGNTFYSSDGNNYYYNVYGSAAVHKGIEIESAFKPVENLTLTAMLSLADNKWTNDIDAYIHPEANPNLEIKYQAFTNGLYVGNHPMTSASLGMLYEKNISKMSEFYFNPVYYFFGKYYSSFDPSQRTSINEKSIQPWRLPDYFRIDVHTGMNFKFEKLFIKSFTFRMDVFNILNSKNIIEAIDGADHSANTVLVWYGRERWWNTSFIFNF